MTSEEAYALQVQKTKRSFAKNSQDIKSNLDPKQFRFTNKKSRQNKSNRLQKLYIYKKTIPTMLIYLLVTPSSKYFDVTFRKRHESGTEILVPYIALKISTFLK